MQNLWDDTVASRCTAPLALRAYGSRLIGGDKTMVLYGGGNTSLKTADTLYVKGTGADLGAVSAALFMPALRRRCSRDVLVRGATVVYAAGTAAVALAGSLYLLLPGVLACGAAWLALLSTLHVSAQTAVPQWVRARALSVYLMVYAAGMTGGAVLWGAMAARWGVPPALLSASAGALIAMFITWRLTLGGEDGLARSAPAALMRSPGHDDIAPERGPVAVHVEYRIAPGDAGAFVVAAQGMERIRRRDGALSWGLFEDPDVPGRYVEYFVDETWVEHLRRHERFTAADTNLRARRLAFRPADRGHHPLPAHAPALHPPPGPGRRQWQRRVCRRRVRGRGLF